MKHNTEIGRRIHRALPRAWDQIEAVSRACNKSFNRNKGNFYKGPSDLITFFSRKQATKNWLGLKKLNIQMHNSH